MRLKTYTGRAAAIMLVFTRVSAARRKLLRPKQHSSASLRAKTLARRVVYRQPSSS